MFNLSSNRRFIPYLLLAPSMILIIVFKMVPLGYTISEGFFPNAKFSLAAYRSLFRDRVFWNSLWITVKLNLVMIPLQILLAFLMAMLANTTVKGIGIFRTIFYLPVTISITVSTILWNMMFSPNNGVINSFLGVAGIPSQGFLIDKNQALWCIVVIATWKGVGYWMMFFLAGLKNIDTEIYESARIDGSRWLNTTVKITIPLLRRVLLFIFMANTTANILLFVPMQMVTGGGPENSTNVLMLEAYKSAFKFVDQPRSVAIVSILLAMILLLCLVQSLVLNEREPSVQKRRARR